MKKVLVVTVMLALAGGVAYANFCARDYVPAATLLVPYAVVDLDDNNVPDPNGYTTILTVTNVSRTAQLVHVSVYDATSGAVVDFDEVLSGYDVWSINFRDLLNGRFDYFDTGTNPKGFFTGTGVVVGPPAPAWGPSSNCLTPGALQPFDTDSISWSGCFFPYGNLESLGPTIVSNLQAAIFSLPQYDSCQPTQLPPPNNPYWSGITDNPVFFYAVVDTVRACGLAFPDSQDYWSATGIGEHDNVLIGDILYFNSGANYSEAIPAVHIEADVDGDIAATQSFYGFNFGPGTDSREPLATAFAFRYFNIPAAGFSTDVIVWKNILDLLRVGNNWYFAADYSYVYYAFDENEVSKSRTGGPSGFGALEPNNLPLETQKVPFDQANWTGLPANAGWVLLVFDPSIPRPVVYPQAWVGVKYTFGSYSAGLDAATMGNAYCFATDILPVLNTYSGGVSDGQVRR